MAEPHSIGKPARWDLPFSLDLTDPAERREMTAADLGELLAREPFSLMQRSSFPQALPLVEILRNDTRIRNYRRGDIIVRQGDYGNSAFLILEGEAQVALEGLDPGVLGRPESRPKSLLRSVARLLTNPRSREVRDVSSYPRPERRELGPQRPGRIYVQDVTNVLSSSPDGLDTCEGPTMVEGALFGELAALGRIPRSATVIAAGADGARLLEIRWQGLRDLRKYDERLREHVGQGYRSHGLSASLESARFLRGLSEDALAEVAGAAMFETHGSYDWHGSYQRLRDQAQDPLSREPIIADEGTSPNGLIMIQTGFARVSRRHGNGELTLRYLGKGEVFGLAELVRGARGDGTVPLGATLRAIGYVDILRIPTPVFEKVILPALPADMLPPAEPAAPDRAVPAGATRATGAAIDPAMMEFLVENRFINGTATMFIDLDRCTRCDDCVTACAAGHDSNPRFIRHGAVFDHYMVANACMHCVDPVCMIGCPTGAIQRSLGDTGEVVINDRTCIGCGTCAQSCPYDNIRMVPIRDRARDDVLVIDPDSREVLLKATKCDLCIDHHGGPACERACPHDALRRIEMRSLDTLASWLGR